jgi:hypothetical protein
MMTLTIPLTPEAEARLRERAAESGKDPVTYAREVREENLTSSHGHEAVEATRPPNQRVAEFLNWVASHRPVGHFVDDSRESIYEGRDE